MQYIDFNDESLPIGKRKQAYVKYAISQGTEKVVALRQVNKKFGFQKKPGIFAIVEDHGRIGQRSFTGTSEVFQGYDLRKYQKWDWAVIDDEYKITKIKKFAKEHGWDLIRVTLVG